MCRALFPQKVQVYCVEDDLGIGAICPHIIKVADRLIGSTQNHDIEIIAVALEIFLQIRHERLIQTLDTHLLKVFSVVSKVPGGVRRKERDLVGETLK